jgi:TRAP-type C4-dicarboxylate transport system substrate-binding protein
MSLPVYSRAHLSRTVALVVALSLTAVSTGADARQFHAAGPIGHQIPDGCEPCGVVGPAFYDSRARSISDGVRPVRSIAGIKRLRLRLQPSGLTSDMIRGLGADPLELPYGQVRTGLATKLIDGAENNWPSFVTTDHYGHAGHYTLTVHTMSPDVLVMSQKARESLSPEGRDMFREAAGWSSCFMRERWRDPAAARLIERIRNVE